MKFLSKDKSSDKLEPPQPTTNNVVEQSSGIVRKRSGTASSAKDDDVEDADDVYTSMQTPPPKVKVSKDEETVSGESTFSSTHSTIRKMVSSVLPKVEPLPVKTFLCLAIWCAIPAAIYILLFTEMGYGELFYYQLSYKFGDSSYIFAGTLIISAFFFYILDIGEWNSAFGKMFRFICILAMFATFVVLVMLVSNEHPFGLISLFALFNPLWMLGVKSIFYRSRDARTFLSWLSGPLLLVAVCTIGAFIGWIAADYDNEWNAVTKIEAAQRSGCEPNFDNYPNCAAEDGAGGYTTCFYVDDTNDHQQLIFPDGCEQSCTNVYNDCANGFILWAGPILMCLSMIFLSFFCTFLRSNGETNEDDIFNFGKLWFFVLFILWASASLSGTAAGVSSSLVTLTLASLLGAFILVSASFSKEEQRHNQKAAWARLHEKYGDNIDIVRGLFVVTCSPIFIAYLFLSAINQLVRRIGINPCSQPSHDSETNTTGIVTVKAKQQLTQMRAWDRAKVFTFAVYWGVVFMVMQVLVANLTVVFLSWMIEKTANSGLVAVTGIMCAVGVLMFLLPPVPGVPVYLTLGIVLSAQGYEILGWGGSIAYATFVGIVLKLFSSALQQKMIGENLSHYTSVRQFVGVNSKLMKSMRLVLGKNGLSVSKVAILIGGPDWPTSVLCGIMKLGLFQILLGTLPIVFLIFPTCLTGALLYMTSIETDTGNPYFPWAGTASTISASATAMVQFGSMLVAAYYLEQAADQRADEVEAIEDDKEVKEADDRDAHLNKCYESVTRWNVVPLMPRFILTCSLVSITTSCYMVQFFTDLCFAPHSLTDSIDENLDGNVANLFLPLGWVSVFLFTASIILLSIFSSWGKVSVCPPFFSLNHMCLYI